MTVVGMVVNWLGAHVLHVLGGNGDGHDVRPPIVRDRREGHGRDILNRHQLVMVMLDSVNFDLLETEQLSEAVG